MPLCVPSIIYSANTQAFLCHTVADYSLLSRALLFGSALEMNTFVTAFAMSRADHDCVCVHRT